MKGQDLFFNLHKSANIMLDKSNRKHKNTYNLNANSIDSSSTNSDGNECHYLTNCAHNTIMEQLSLSKSCRAMRYDKTTYLVYKPKDVNKNTEIYHRDSLDFELSML